MEFMMEYDYNPSSKFSRLKYTKLPTNKTLECRKL